MEISKSEFSATCCLFFILGIVLSAVVNNSVYFIPIETPLQKKCEEVGSDLSSYNSRRAICDNGWSFSRSDDDGNYETKDETKIPL